MKNRTTQVTPAEVLSRLSDVHPSLNVTGPAADRLGRELVDAFVKSQSRAIRAYARRWATARQQHFDFHSRQLPMSQCAVAECRAAVKGSLT